MTDARLFDLVRFSRGFLHEAGLITDSEYAWLVAEADLAKGEGSPSPRRLESYDEVRQKLDWLLDNARHMTVNVSMAYCDQTQKPSVNFNALAAEPPAAYRQWTKAGDHRGRFEEAVGRMARFHALPDGTEALILRLHSGDETPARARKEKGSWIVTIEGRQPFELGPFYGEILQITKEVEINKETTP